jgi:peroxin-1
MIGIYVNSLKKKFLASTFFIIWLHFYVSCWSQVSLASDASLEDVASLTEGFTGADLAAILTDAGLAAIHEVLDSRESGIPEGEPCISKELLMSVAMKARPSTPVDDKRGYDKEFGEFVSSRKSISTKVLLRTLFHNIQAAYFPIEYSNVHIRFTFTCNSCLSSVVFHA